MVKAHCQADLTRQGKMKPRSQPFVPVIIEIVVQAQQALAAVEQKGIAVRRSARHRLSSVLQNHPTRCPLPADPAPVGPALQTNVVPGSGTGLQPAEQTPASLQPQMRPTHPVIPQSRLQSDLSQPARRPRLLLRLFLDLLRLFLDLLRFLLHQKTGEKARRLKGLFELHGAVDGGISGLFPR